MRETGNKALRSLLALGLLVMACMAAANDVALQKAQLQVDINAIGKDISILERNMKFPAASRVEVFVSLASGLEYTPNEISLLVDGKQVATYSYSRADVKSLRYGALHTLWQGNLPAGNYRLQAVITGQEGNGKPVQSTASLDFEKGANSRTLEVKLMPHPEERELVFLVKDWGDMQ